MIQKTPRGEFLEYGPSRYEGEYEHRGHRGVETPHGWGTLTVSPGREYDTNYLDGEPRLIKSYVGKWTDGAPHGQGILTLNGGACYEGEWEWYKLERYQPDSRFYGQYRWYSWVETRHWKLRGGRGTITLANGIRYEGKWQSQENKSDEDRFTERAANLHGQGTETWPDGERYEGEWREGKLYRGTLTLSDGTRYEGEWQTGYLYHSVDGHNYVGPTPPDGMRDPARYTYRPRSERGFDNLYGRGTLTLPNGTCSEGEWRNGRLHGHGTETWPDGEQFVGELRYGAAWRGTLTMADGVCIEYRYGKAVSTFVVPHDA